MKRFWILCTLLLSVLIGSAQQKVYVVSIHEAIAPPASLRINKAFREAEQMKAEAVLLRLNTFGGTLEDADKIRTIILGSEIPVYVWIEVNAASAGALIALACDSIYMTKGSSIGAATVVDATGEVQPDKYQSYMRSMMRATAEATGRDPDIAQAMVDPSVYIPNVSDTGKVLTLTVNEAVRLSMAEAEANTIEEVLAKVGMKDYHIQEQRLTVLDKVIVFFVNPVVSGLLILLIIAGLYLEFQSPGIGIPAAVAVLAALLYFAPLYLEGFAEHWEIVLFVVGLILIVCEIFILPGFGVCGFAGVLACLFGLSLSLVDNVGFDFSRINPEAIIQAFLTVTLSLFVAVPFSIWLGRKLLGSRRLGFHLALEQCSDEGYTVRLDEMDSLIGSKGKALTILRPVGKVEINRKVYNGVASISYIEKGENIEVVGHENIYLKVVKTKE